jgi:hypothetical protein
MLFRIYKPTTLLITVLLISCCFFTNCSTKEPKVVSFMEPTLVVQLNQLIYRDTASTEINKNIKNVEVVWNPKSINGNYALVVKEKNKNAYTVVIRGSKIEFSDDGFQNWIMQDFNFFSMKKWNYTDTVKDAYISQGSQLGFENILQLRDLKTDISLEKFITDNIEKNSFIISGHSLGGNLTQVFAAYMHKKLSKDYKAHINIITYGATAAGNKEFVKDLEEKFPTGIRYAIDKDIAPLFPNPEAFTKLQELIKLDSSLKVPSINIKGITINTNDALNAITGITDLIGLTSTKNYSQSSLHLKPLSLSIPDNTKPDTEIIKNGYEKIFYYHKIDSYAQCILNPNNP